MRGERIEGSDVLMSYLVPMPMFVSSGVHSYLISTFGERKGTRIKKMNDPDSNSPLGISGREGRKGGGHGSLAPLSLRAPLPTSKNNVENKKESRRKLGTGRTPRFDFHDRNLAKKKNEVKRNNVCSTYTK